MLGRFLRDRRGAVTIDWTIAAAGLIALTLVVVMAIKAGYDRIAAQSMRMIGGVHVLGTEDMLIAAQDFERGAPGWSDSATDASAPGFGGVLGRHAGTGGQEALSRDFALDPSRDFAVLSFDVHAIDDWALEELIVFIDGSEALRQRFSSRPELADRQTTTILPRDGITVETSRIRTSERGFAADGPETRDQTISVLILVEATEPTLRVGFGSSLGTQDTGLASWAVDNFRLVATDTPPRLR